MTRIPTTMFLTLASALALVPAWATEVPFGPEQVASYQESPSGIEAADIDGDGDDDLVSYNRTGADQGVWWHENEDGLGGFALPTQISSTSSLAQTNAIMTGDIDGDGDLDVVEFSIVTINWYENTDGAGTFGPENRITNGAIHNGIDLGDVDGDGDLDVVTALQNSNVVQWVENLGGGSFGSPSSNRQLVGAMDTARDAKLTDIDGDGDLDVTALSFDLLRWSENTDGAGTFGPFQTILSASSNNFFDVEAGDVDGDGDMDVVSVAWSFQLLRWHENTAGDGSAWTHVTIGAPGSGFWKTVPVDMDLDGDLDFVAQSLTEDEVLWYENTAADGSAWTERLITDSLVDPSSFTVGDFDGDGDPDVASESGADGKLSWFENRTIHRNSLYTGRNTVVSTTTPQGVATTDVDGDGDLDAVMTSVPESKFAWYENTAGDGSAWTERTIAAVPDLSQALPGDADGDGDVDLFTYAITPTDEFAWWDNTAGDGSAWTKRTIAATPNQAAGIAPADVDGDGDLDAFGTVTVPTVTAFWYENTAGDGSAWTPHSIGGSSGTRPFAADMDRDGDADLVCVSDLNRATWYENTSGDGSTWTDHMISTSAPSGFEAGDLDGDGDLDVLARFFGEVVWYENTDGGATAWTEHSLSTSVSFAVTATIVDVDLDGDSDVVTASFNNNEITVHENLDGAGSFGSELLFVGSGFLRPAYLVSGDLDRDGDPDLLIPWQIDNEIAWHENRGGQLGIAGADVDDGTAPEGEQTSLLVATVTLNGRPGDSVARLATMDLLFEDTGSSPLSSAQANALIDNLLIYRDDGSGTFDPAEDILVQTVTSLNLTGGVETVTLPASDPNALVAAPAGFFVVGELTSDASSQSPSDFKVTHRSETGSTAFDATAGIPLSAEYSPDFQSQTISSVGRFVVDSTSDAVDAVPGDGFCDDGSGNCTLRAAIQEANALSGDNRIVLDEATYTLSIPGKSDDVALTGDLDITEAGSTTTIVGAGAGRTIVDADATDRVFHVRNGSYAVFEDLTVTGGDSPTSGTVAWGGGVYFDLSAGVIRRCEVRDNSAGVGGGMAVFAFSGEVIDLLDSVFHGNTGTTAGDAIVNNFVTLNATNCTVSDNHNAGGRGAILQQSSGGNLNLTSCTVTGNDVGIESLAGTFTVQNSIIAGNGDDIDQPNPGYTSLGHNLIGDVGVIADFVDGVNDDQVGGNGNPVIAALLGPLGDNGGPTLTHALEPSSPALDAGTCASLTQDQRGEPRPIDLPAVANVDDGCDVGAYESRSGPALPRVEVPVRWCGLRGAPSIEDPSLVGETTVNDVLRKRHERASDNIYRPLANIAFRSAGNVVAEDYPVLDDPDCIEGPPGVFTCDVGQQGEVFVDLDEANFEEFQFLVAACRRAWEALDPDIQGVTAVHINRFVDETGAPLEILGVGGRAGQSVEAEQAMGGRVMVVDNVYRLDVPANPDVPNPPDAIDRLLGHEMGHALSLQHGDGVDNDNDGELDNDDDQTDGLPRFDGPNLMQYRNGTELTVAQIEQARNHMDDALPDVDVQPLTDAVADEAPIELETKRILQFGYDGLTELENKRILQFDNASVLQFEQKRILQFENKRILQFEQKRILQFENKRILQFGMDYDGTLVSNRTRISGAMGSLPWPAPIRPTTRYFFYLDLDRDDATGAYPPNFANPELPGSNFPGSNNFVGEADVTEEAGIDLIAQVELSSSCPGMSCSSTAVMKVFDYDDGMGQYDLVLTDPNPDLTAVGVELYLDNGGQEIEEDNIPTELVIQPELDNSILFAAGWGFATPGGGAAPVPQRVRMEVVTTVECVGNILNDDPSSAVVDCQCTDCADCPDYPGCFDVLGTPKTLAGSTILTDCKLGELTFEPPLLPSCVSIPQLAIEASPVTVAVTNLPDDVTGTVEVVVGDTVVGTQAIAPVDDGSVDVSVLLPAGSTGPVRLSTGIVGLAPRADCIVDVTPALACADNDGDDECDSTDADDDNDGVGDGSDSDPFNPFLCRDSDADGCDDCSSGTDAPLHDGSDYDLDGICDAGDPDDDNDGVPDGSDGEPHNANACGDSDADDCDDCLTGFPADPSDDGPDFDLDGQCDFGDPDDDNDGTIDAADCAPNDGTLEGIPSGFAGVTLGPDKNRVAWSSFFDEFGSATTVDLLRGDLMSLPVGSGAETCLLGGSSASFYDDGTPVPPGTGTWYVLRGDNACGAGDYGEESDGTPRTSAICP